MSFGFSRLLPRILYCCSLVLAIVAAQAADSPFVAASAAFERGDYRDALSLFEAARAAGAEGPSVRYNMGVCLYKLGEYAAADAEFAELGLRFPAMRAVAEYNRGLALLGLERADDARAAFASAEAAGDAKIAALADQRLRELGARSATSRAAAASHWQGLFELGGGDDDNVALVDDIALPAGLSADSTFTELWGFARRRWGGRAPVRLDVSGYAVRYFEASEFDQDSLRAAVAFERAHGAWRLDFGPHYDRSTLDGDGFQGELGVGLRADRPLSAGWRFAASILYSDVAALEPRFAYLEGARRQARAALVRRVGGSRFDVSVDVEDSDRAAPSVSARRERLALGYRRDVTTDWSVGGAVSYRASRYDRTFGPNERLTELRVDASRAIGSDWVAQFSYRRSSNDADVASFSYDSNRLTISIGRDF